MYTYIIIYMYLSIHIIYIHVIYIYILYIDIYIHLFISTYSHKHHWNIFGYHPHGMSHKKSGAADSISVVGWGGTSCHLCLMSCQHSLDGQCDYELCDRVQASDSRF